MNPQIKSQALNNQQANLGPTLRSLPSQIGAAFSLPGQGARSAQAAQDARNIFGRAQKAGAFPGQTFRNSFPSQNAFQASQGVGVSDNPVELPPLPISVDPEPPAEPPLPNPMPITPGNMVGRRQEINPGGTIPSYKKGGKVRKTGLAYLHKGEHVIPVAKSQALKSKLKDK